MNARDSRIMKYIISHIDSGEKNRLLVNVKHIYVSRINLLILRALLDEKKKTGVFITLDRPHQYMSHLLKIHKIRQDRLIFVDGITNISGEVRAESGNVGFLDGPFQIDLLAGIFLKIEEGNQAKKVAIDLKEIDFMLVDNPAAMLTYNGINTVKKFFENYLQMLTQYKSIFTALVIDKESHPAFFGTLRKLCDLEIDIDYSARSNDKRHLEIIKAIMSLDRSDKSGIGLRNSYQPMGGV